MSFCRSRIDIDFPNVMMQVLFPTSIDCDCMAVRSMYLRYDHLSDLCENFYMPEMPSLFTTGKYIAEKFCEFFIVKMFFFLRQIY